jgi:hypothetical protein
MGVRELVWLLIAALLAYGGWQFLRALAAGRRQSAPPASAAAGSDDDEDGDDEDDDFDYAPLPAARPAPAAAAAPVSAPAAVAARAESSAPPAGDVFQIELELRRVRREMAALRAAIDVQQQEIGSLHGALAALGKKVESGVGLPSASPEYNEALVFARRGLSAEAIAERCGITVAEAALVHALAARKDDGEGGLGAQA